VSSWRSTRASAISSRWARTKRGADAKLDQVLAKLESIEAFLRQGKQERSAFRRNGEGAGEARVTAPIADVLIVAPAAPGLSLAVALLDAGLRSRIVLVDPRPTSAPTGRGASSTTADAPALHGLRHAFLATWEVRSPAQTVVRSAAGLRYCHVPSERFYAARSRRLEIASSRARRVRRGAARRRRCGPRTDGPRDGAAGATCVRLATLVRRPRPDRRRSRPLLQHFVGHVVATDRDVFDPELATLMDFSVSQEDGVHFMYVRHSARSGRFVESTFFTTKRLPLATYERAIGAHLRDAMVSQTGASSRASKARSR